MHLIQVNLIILALMVQGLVLLVADGLAAGGEARKSALPYTGCPIILARTAVTNCRNELIGQEIWDNL